ncbi:MAG: hypothetical protein IPK19_34780 [Chloroflexi bacterium]|nr:hypothetical protein [Chloroflexota bacterium]
MEPLEAAVLRTILYADIFNFPLTPREVHHFLIAPQAVTPAQVEHALASLSERDILNFSGGFVMLAGRSELAGIRQRREAAATALWPKAVLYGRWLGRLPFVRMVAITGALAMRNPSDADDDLDYFLVTAHGRVWLARLCAIAVVRLSKLRGVVVCPNFVLAETALVQSRRDLFIAHEVTQMVPVVGRNLYDLLRRSHLWVVNLLPNAEDAFYLENDDAPRGIWNLLKTLTERALGGAIGDRLEAWEFRRKVHRFSPKMHIPDSAAQLDENQVKGHFNDHGHPVLRRYQELLDQYGLSDPNTALPLAGD